MKAIETIRELRELSHIEEHQDGCECFIALNGGARSRKQIWYQDDELWEVMHYVDESTFEYHSDEEFMDGEPNIFEAMSKGSLIQY